MKKTLLIAMLLAGTAITSGCAPIAGGAMVVAADYAMEQENGDEGLF